MNEISANDKAIFLDILNLYYRGEVSGGCGDYDLPNTPENRDFVKRMNAANSGCEDDEWSSEPPSASDKTLCVNDWEIMAYFIHLMEK